MIDIFLSYAHEDRPRIDPLIRALEAQGWNVWWDRDIRTGFQFDVEIETSIKSARCVLVVWSKHSVDSKWVRSEAHEGFDRDILVPMLLDDVLPPMPFRLVQAGNFFDPPLSDDSDFSALIGAIRHALSGESATAVETRPKQPRGKRLLADSRLILLALLAALLSLWLVFRLPPFTPAPAGVVAEQELNLTPPAENSIAVLPFLNLSGDPANDYFSDGIAEEILNSIASIGSFKVTARSSSFSFRGQQLDIPTIGRRLNVGHLLEGSVRKQGNSVRISVQLVNAQDGSQIWVSSYDRELGDIFAVQEDISRNIVRSLKIALGGYQESVLENRPSAEFAAFDLYLLGRHYWYQRTVEGIDKSIELFKQSIEIQPEFVLAYTGLADAYNLLTAYGNLSGQEAAAMMKPVVEKAMELDDSLAEVHTSYGAMLGNQGLLDLEEAEYRKAIAINDNYALAFIWLGNNLLVRGKLIEGTRIFEQARELDPMNPAVILNLARSKMYQGEIEQALAYAEEIESLVPDSALVYEQKSWMLREYGRLVESLVSARKAVELDPEGAQVLASAAASEIALGNLESAGSWIERASQSAPDNWHVIWVKAEYYFLLGQQELFEAYTNERLAYALEDKTHVGPDLKTAYLWAGLAQLQGGRFAQAAAYLDAAFSPSIEHQFEAEHELRFRAYRILAHRLAGDVREAETLLTEALNYIASQEEQGWRVPEFLVHAASINLLAGDPDGALVYLQAAVDGGFRFILTYENDPVLRSLQGDPLYENLRSVIEQDVAEMQHNASSQK